VQAESWPTQGEHSSLNSRSDKKPWYARRQSARDSGAKAPVFIVIFCGRTTFCDGVSHFSLSLPYGDCFNFLIGLFFWLVACSKPYIRHRFRSCWAHARGMLCLLNALSCHWSCDCHTLQSCFCSYSNHASAAWSHASSYWLAVMR